MKEENFKKLGFFSALSICISSIVGIGIFFKNKSIAAEVNGNGWAWISTWIISGAIAFLVAIHFGKIAMVKTNGPAGLSGWAQNISTKKQNWFRHTVTINYSFFYNSILSIVLSFFSIEFFVRFLQLNNKNVNIPIYGVAILSIALLLFYVFLNKISIKSSGIFTSITTVLKFVPLIIAIFVGIGLPNSNHQGGVNAFIPSNENKNDSFVMVFQGMMKSLPAALFGFDAFVGVGSLSKKIKGGEKIVSKVFIMSMLLVVMVYLLVTMATILHYDSKGAGAVESIIQNVFASNKNIENGLSVFVVFFIFISATGTTNAIIAGAVSEFENISLSEKVFFSKQLNKKIGYKNSGLVYQLLALTFWWLVILIPTILMNSDNFVDGMSNYIVFFFFLVYATLIFLYWKNIYIKKTTHKSKYPWIYSIFVFISIIGVFLSMLLSLIFVILSAIQDKNGNSNWGLYINDASLYHGVGIAISNLVVVILQLVFALIFVLLPLINYLLFRFQGEKNLFKNIDLEIENQNDLKLVNETNTLP